MATPVEKSYWWTTGGAGDGSATYTRADLSCVAQILAACFGGEGVGIGYLNSYATTTGANKVTVGTGVAVVDGKPHICSVAGDISIPSSTAGNTRIDRIVLRADWTAQTVRLTRIAGTDSGSPTAPAITQTSGTTWDCLLYQVRVTAAGVVTIELDERTLALPILTACSILARTANSAGKAVQLAAAANNTVLARSGDVLAFQPVSRAMLADGILTADAAGRLKMADGFLTGPKIAAYAVGINAIATMVAGLLGRQGGSASDWSAPGAGNYVSGINLRLQFGAAQTASNLVDVTFPVAFSNKPIVLATAIGSAAYISSGAGGPPSTTGVRLGTGGPSDVVFWLAIGPE